MNDMRKAIEQRLMADPVLAGLFRSLEQDNRKREAAAAKKAPLAHKQSKVFDNASYRYWDAGRDGRGSRVLFCYSVHRNVAGFFLGWRETHYRKKVVRSMWLSRRVKKRCIEIGRRRMEAFKAAHQKQKPPQPQVGVHMDNRPVFSHKA